MQVIRTHFCFWWNKFFCVWLLVEVFSLRTLRWRRLIFLVWIGLMVAVRDGCFEWLKLSNRFVTKHRIYYIYYHKSKQSFSLSNKYTFIISTTIKRFSLIKHSQMILWIVYTLLTSFPSILWSVRRMLGQFSFEVMRFIFGLADNNCLNLFKMRYTLTNILYNIAY